VNKKERIEDQLPLIYRFILKLPNVILDYFPGSFQGIFWAIIVPIFISLEFLITMFLLILFPFPINIFMAGSIPTVIFIIFVKIELQRFINVWNTMVQERGLEWNIDRIAKEYFSLIDKQESRENEAKSVEHKKD